MKIGAKLKEKREALGLTIEELSVKSSIRADKIEEFEGLVLEPEKIREKLDLPDPDAFALVLKALKYSPLKLIAETIEDELKEGIPKERAKIYVDILEDITLSIIQSVFDKTNIRHKHKDAGQEV